MDSSSKRRKRKEKEKKKLQNFRLDSANFVQRTRAVASAAKPSEGRKSYDGKYQPSLELRACLVRDAQLNQ